MEGEVGRGNLGGLVGGLEVLQRHLQGPKLGPDPPAGGESRPLRFDDSTHLIEVAQQPKVGCRAILPVKDVAIESIPLRSSAYVGANVWTGGQEPLRGQDLDRLADGGAAGTRSASQPVHVDDIPGPQVS